MDRKNQAFDWIKINLASPEKIKQWSEKILPSGEIVGEVTKAETINYKTLRAEIGGLFCPRIFGPERDWECICGLYKNGGKAGVVCEICGVEVTESRVRRHRMGYIDLLSPVAHVWYLKGRPSYLSYVLDIKLRELERIIYFDKFFENKIYGMKEFLSFDEFDFVSEEKFGAEIIHDLLKSMDVNKEITDCRVIIMTETKIKVEKALRRIRILENFLTTKSKPEWMILSSLPVLPPGLRPMLQLENGKFAASDLNELYRLVINRNNRLARLFVVHAPSVVTRTEKRLLQQAVDGLIDNGKRGSKIVDTNNRPLKSLADNLEGKQGRFRQNLLGKRVDYSGRSVIIVGPQLELHQCGLPYEMATELFLPFILRQLLELNYVSSVKAGKRFIQVNPTFIWQLLTHVLKDYPILLNRAPTLHRLGVQAFEPILVKLRAIQLHPLVCPAFNADFDGDQMGVHIPLSSEAKLETKLLMFAPTNFLSPANGQPMIQPTQDMLLGCYYLTTLNRPSMKGSYRYFANFEDVLFAYQQNQIDLHASIWVRCPKNYPLPDNIPLIKSIKLEDESNLKIYQDLQIKKTKKGETVVKYLRTTVGRILFNQIFHTTLNF